MDSYLQNFLLGAGLYFITVDVDGMKIRLQILYVGE